jgi:hypothetical protein
LHVTLCQSFRIKTLPPGWERVREIKDEFL